MKEYSSGRVRNVKQARLVASETIRRVYEQDALDIGFGLPEREDRDNTWIVPLIADFDWLIRPDYLGQIRVDWDTAQVVHFTDPTVVASRLGNARQRIEIPEQDRQKGGRNAKRQPPPPNLGCSIYLGKSQDVLPELPRGAAQLVITSPPYYNARPGYAEYVDYREYLDELEQVFKACHDVLSEGRFFIVNSSPVLQRRISRKFSSRRIPVPFDIHHIVSRLGFEFIDDIIWNKPEGAGWNTGRGRRFRADRNPLQYKPVPVTEYFMVYRKATRKLIDWNLRTHHDPDLVKASRIEDPYHVTNVWEATPASHPHHPAVFPKEIVSELIRYYSFKGDTILDPFAGSGTVGQAALELGRRFLLIDSDEDYCRLMVKVLAPMCVSLGQAFDTNVPIDDNVRNEAHLRLDVSLREALD
jgi:DNA modification methylase